MGDGVIDSLVSELVEIFEPVAEKLHVLCEDDSTDALISIFRSFDSEDGVEEDESSGLDLPPNFVRLSGQHQLLGFHFDLALMKRLIALKCEVSFDEYG